MINQIGKSRFWGAGYRRVDNRVSGGTLEESDVLGCLHCQALIMKAAWVEEGAYCHKCDGPICSECDKNPDCVPFMKQLDQAVDAAYKEGQKARLFGI
jgi:hypothetical protein